MKVPFSWLRDFCPVEISAEELAERITAQGVHVESILRPWAGLSGVIVAKIVEKRAHPNSSKLTLATLDTGRGQAHIAAGVANWEVGDLVPYAPPGSRVPTVPEPLGVKPMGGERSEGMICSPHELAISADHGGILVLPADLSLGADFAELFGLDEAVLDIEIEPNRPDLMSVFGVAREASAATNTPLAPPDFSVTESLEAASGAATVEVRDQVRCPQYRARVIRDVTMSASPIRVQARLTAAGMRPISGVVDATNYVLLEVGQPLHPFDLHGLDGDGVIVRRAADGERLVTLDDVERMLTTDDLVIADRTKGVGIAGVMGAADAEVSDQTTDVLLESAHFERKGILFTARRLKLSTEASSRFERGVDPELPGPAVARTARLISEWAGGRVLGGEVGTGSAPDRRRLRVRPTRTSFLLASPISVADIGDAFGRLGMAAIDAGEDSVEVEVPGHRVDIEVEVDLIEEVARVRGYANLPSTVPGITQAGGLADTVAFRRRVRDALVRAGMRETTALSFASQDELDLSAPDRARDAVRVANPIDVDRAFLRASLLPGLLRGLRLNLSRQTLGAALFEVGHVFTRAGDEQRADVTEREHVGGALTGPAALGYPERARDFDFFDAKGAVEALMASLGVEEWSLGGPAAWPYHPGRSALVTLREEPIGSVGELHPRGCEDADIAGVVAAFELDADALAGRARAETTVADVSRFPPVRRDLAFLLDESVAAGAVASAIREAAEGLAGAITLFDVFVGEPLAAGKKNLAFSVEFRAADRTLTDAEVDRAVGAAAGRIEQTLGGQLRTG